LGDQHAKGERNEQHDQTANGVTQLDSPSLAVPLGLQHEVTRLWLRVRRTASRRASHP
jgi:hypothetical protein